RHVELAQRHAQYRPQARIQAEDLGGRIELLLGDRERIGRVRGIDRLRHERTPSAVTKGYRTANASDDARLLRADTQVGPYRRPTTDDRRPTTGDRRPTTDDR